MSDPIEAEVVEHISTMAFEPTVERIARGIADAGLMLFARIDHAAGARRGIVDVPSNRVELRPCQRRHPDHVGLPQAALDLPLRVLVREREDGRAVIAFHPIVPMLRRAGVPDELSARLEPAQRLLLEAVAS